MTSKEYQFLATELLSQPLNPLDSEIEARKRLDHLFAQFPADIEVDFLPCTLASLAACWAFAPDCNRDKIILYFHSGAFPETSLAWDRNIIGHLSQAADCTVLTIDHQRTFPGALDDALAVYRELLLYHQPKEIILAGIAAGAGLSLAVSLKLKEDQLPQPAAIVAMSPWIDFTLSSSSLTTNQDKDWISRPQLQKIAQTYCGQHDPKSPLISPYYGDLYGLPPLLIQVGTHELLLDEAIALAEKASKSGVDVTFEQEKDLFHGWQLFAPAIREANKSLDQIGNFLQQKT